MPVMKRDLDIMTALKGSTAVHHKAMEGLMPFFGPEFQLSTYARVLGALLGFHEPLESQLAAIEGWPEVGIDLQQRSRVRWLRSDLHALGISESHIARLPRCTNLPRLKNCDDGLGCLYVVEGSTLGGQLITRELVRRFGIDQNSGAAFFYSYGAAVGAMWGEFCSVVQSRVSTLQQQTAVVSAANSTFRTFEKWMRKVDKQEPCSARNSARPPGRTVSGLKAGVPADHYHR